MRPRVLRGLDADADGVAPFAFSRPAVDAPDQTLATATEKVDCVHAGRCVPRRGVARRVPARRRGGRGGGAPARGAAFHGAPTKRRPPIVDEGDELCGRAARHPGAAMHGRRRPRRALLRDHRLPRAARAAQGRGDGHLPTRHPRGERRRGGEQDGRPAQPEQRLSKAATAPQKAHLKPTQALSERARDGHPVIRCVLLPRIRGQPDLPIKVHLQFGPRLAYHGQRKRGEDRRAPIEDSRARQALRDRRARVAAQLLTLELVDVPLGRSFRE